MPQDAHSSPLTIRFDNDLLDILNKRCVQVARSEDASTLYSDKLNLITSSNLIRALIRLGLECSDKEILEKTFEYALLRGPKTSR